VTLYLSKSKYDAKFVTGVKVKVSVQKVTQAKVRKYFVTKKYAGLKAGKRSADMKTCLFLLSFSFPPFIPLPSLPAPSLPWGSRPQIQQESGGVL